VAVDIPAALSGSKHFPDMRFFLHALAVALDCPPPGKGERD